jgi:hypothetical protein
VFRLEHLTVLGLYWPEYSLTAAQPNGPFGALLRVSGAPLTDSLNKVDLDGDGRITTISDAANDRALNWDGSGFDKQVGWVGGGEGLLWLDRNPNGIVDGGKELFSNSAVADAAKGLRSMSWVDANADGVIDASDPVFAELEVWQDADGDAVADFDECSRAANEIRWLLAA